MKGNDCVSSYLKAIDNTIGKSWTFRILLEMRKFKQVRFIKLLNALDGISSSTLTICLEKLCLEGLVEKHSHGDTKHTSKTGYSLTDKGFEFMIAVNPLLKWAVIRQLRLQEK